MFLKLVDCMEYITLTELKLISQKTGGSLYNNSLVRWQVTDLSCKTGQKIVLPSGIHQKLISSE